MTMGEGNEIRGLATRPVSTGKAVEGPTALSGGRQHPAAGVKTVPVSENLLSIAWRNRWVLFLSVVSALVAGMVYVQTATPIYVSSSRLYLDYGGVPIPRSYEPGRVPRTERYLHTQAQLLRSRPILGKVLESLDLRQLRTFEKIDIPLAYLRRKVQVTVGRRDEVITVSFESPFPLEASDIVNSIVDAYLESRSEHEKRSSAQLLRLLEDERARATEELRGKRNALADFEANGMPLSLGSGQGGGVMEHYLALQVERTRANAATVEARLFLDGVQALADDSEALRQYLTAEGRTAGYTVGRTERALLEEHRGSLKVQLEGLAASLTPDHQKIKALEDAVERTSVRLSELDDGLVKATLAAARQRYVKARDAEADLIAQCEEQQARVEQQNAEVSQHARLRSEVEQLEAHYQTVGQQIREIRTLEGEEIGQLQMARLEPALAAEEPSSPRKSRIMAAALVGGMLLGGALAVGRDALNQTFQSAEEISAYLGQTVLGVVPRMSRRQNSPERGQIVWLRPKSPEAEAFRTIRTSIFFGAPRENAKTLLVTSAHAGDGKSTLVSNLGIAMAQAGQETIILDADFRKPVQHSIFGVNHREQGLKAVLSGAVPLTEAIQPAQVSGLSLLTCEAAVHSPAEVINSPSFSKILARLTQMYDRVLIDAPPVTLVTDAQILGALCDMAVLVLRANRSTKKASKRAVGALESVGTHLLGVMVNDVREAGDRYGYYGGYEESPGKDEPPREEGRDRSSSLRRLAKPTLTAVDGGCHGAN